MLTYLLIALGGALGSMARFAVASVIDSGVRDTFPLGTVLVNISGCLIIGFFFALTVPTGRFNVPAEFRQFFMVGICGGYTTFSSFGLQNPDAGPLRRCPSCRRQCGGVRRDLPDRGMAWLAARRRFGGDRGRVGLWPSLPGVKLPRLRLPVFSRGFGLTISPKINPARS